MKPIWHLRDIVRIWSGWERDFTITQQNSPDLPGDRVCPTGQFPCSPHTASSSTCSNALHETQFWAVLGVSRAFSGTEMRREPSSRGRMRSLDSPAQDLLPSPRSQIRDSGSWHHKHCLGSPNSICDCGISKFWWCHVKIWCFQLF